MCLCRDKLQAEERHLSNLTYPPDVYRFDQAIVYTTGFAVPCKKQWLTSSILRVPELRQGGGQVHQVAPLDQWPGAPQALATSFRLCAPRGSALSFDLFVPHLGPSSLSKKCGAPGVTYVVERPGAWR